MDEELVDMQLPESQRPRDVIRFHSVRAMQLIGEQKVDEAIAEIDAMANWSQHVFTQHFVIPKLTGIAVSQVTRDCAVAILSQRGMSFEQSRRLEQVVNKLSESTSVRETMREHERLIAMSTMVQFFRDLQSDWQRESERKPFTVGVKLKTDPNISLSSPLQNPLSTAAPQPPSRGLRAQLLTIWRSPRTP